MREKTKDDNDDVKEREIFLYLACPLKEQTDIGHLIGISFIVSV